MARLRTSKGFSILVALALALALGIVAVPLAGTVEASPGTIHVDINDPSCVNGTQPNPYACVYCNIQDAIDDAAPTGDTIIVHPGTYYEDVDVDKEHLTIRSFSGDPADTIVNGDANDDVFDVTADYVAIRGFSITGGDHLYDGVYLYYSDYCEISHNIITGNSDGIDLENSHHNTITDNFISQNWYSCPFVYSWDGQEYRLDSMMLNNAAGQAKEKTDYDKLDYLAPADGEYLLKLTEELFETSYVDELKLVVVDHPSGTQIIPDAQGNIHTLRVPYAPTAAKEEDGTDCVDEVKTTDGICWSSDLNNKDFSEVEDLRDGIILTFEKPEDAETAKVAVSFRDTKLAEWITYGVSRLPTDSPGQRSLLIKFLRCLYLEVWNGTEWVPEGNYVPPSPFIGRDEIKLIDISAIEGDTIKIKLESATGAVLIDSVRMDYSADEAVIASELSATTAVDADGIDVAPEIRASDDDYLVLEQGDYVYLSFGELAANPGYDRSYVAKTEGYYESPLMAPAQGEAYEELAEELLSDHLYAARYFLESALRSGHCGIYLGWSNDNEISGNEVADNDPEPGIYVSYNSNGNQIIHNDIHGNSYGIDIANGISSVSIRDCFIHGNSGFGIHVAGAVEASSITIEGNAISENGYDGINFGSGASPVFGNVTIRDNIIGAWTCYDGDYGYSGSPQRYYGNGDRGIEINQVGDSGAPGTVTIEGNKISENHRGAIDETGIYIWNIYGVVTIEGNDIGTWTDRYGASYLGNNGAGIVIANVFSGAELTIGPDNSIKHNLGDGIAIGLGEASSDIEIHHNQIDANGGKDGTEPIGLERKIIEGCGIKLGSGGVSGAIVSDNVITNHREGIYLDSASAQNTIQGNLIRDNGHGLWIEGDDNRITRNDILNNSLQADSGIHLTSTAERNIIHCNNIEGNYPGISNENVAEVVDAISNWWGDASGPSGAGPGTGDAVSGNVNYSSWLPAAFQYCRECQGAPAAAVPAVNQWGIVAMITLFAGLLVWRVRRRRLAS